MRGVGIRGAFWAGVLAVACALPAVPAAAAEPGPVADACYAFTEDQLAWGTLAGARAAGADAYWDAWADDARVPCSRPHTFEVTEVSPLPADVDAFAFAAEQCTSLGVWTAAGVNRTRAGIVRTPLRVEPRGYAVRQMPGYACGAVVAGTGERASAVPVAGHLRDLTAADRAALRYCTDEARAPSPRTVACSAKARWRVDQWIVWTAFYDANPGRGELRSRAAALCGAGATATLPRAADWTAGMPLTWCFQRTGETSRG